MNREEFLSRLKQDMENNKELMPELHLPDVIQLLFGSLNVHTSELEKVLISLRTSHGIDHIMAIPEHKRSMSVRFWLIGEKKIPLLENVSIEGEITND